MYKAIVSKKYFYLDLVIVKSAIVKIKIIDCLNIIIVLNFVKFRFIVRLFLEGAWLYTIIAAKKALSRHLIDYILNRIKL